MSGAIKKIGNTAGQFLGLKSPTTKPYGGPQNYYTPYSSSVNGNVTLDPSIRNLQDQGLNKSNAIYGDVGEATGRYLSNTNSLRDSLSGNTGAFIQSRVNPVLQNFESLRGRTRENIGLRGLSGSSFADQSMRNIETDASRAEGDARSQATMETISAQSGLDSNALQAVMQKATLQAGLNNENFQVASQRLQQELASLGLGSQQIQQFMSAWAQDQQNNLTGYSAQTQRISSLFGGQGAFGSSGAFGSRGAFGA